MEKTTFVYFKQQVKRYFAIANQLSKYFNNLDTQKAVSENLLSQ